MRLAASPLWLKWVLSVTFFAGLLVALVIYVHGAGDRGPGSAENPAAEARANRLGQIVTAQDQAVHQMPLARSLGPARALEDAILIDMRARIMRHDVNGPVQQVRCSQNVRRRTNRLSFRCQALTGGFAYPFAGIVDLRTRELVWCKDDSSSVDPGLQVPLNAACRS